MLAKAALPLLRAGRADEARRRLPSRATRWPGSKISLLPAVGQHIEFCALTGNEARGLEILAEHQGWLADQEVSAYKRLDFLSGVAVLLRRLTRSGTARCRSARRIRSRPCPRRSRRRSARSAGGMTRGTATAPSATGSPRGLAQEPLADRVAAWAACRGCRLRRSLSAGPVAASGSAARRRRAARRSQASGAGGAGLDELIARARELGMTAASWRGRGVGAGRGDGQATSGRELPGDVAALVARFSAGALLRTDPAAGARGTARGRRAVRCARGPGRRA